MIKSGQPYGACVLSPYTQERHLFQIIYITGSFHYSKMNEEHKRGGTRSQERLVKESVVVKEDRRARRVMDFKRITQRLLCSVRALFIIVLIKTE